MLKSIIVDSNTDNVQRIQSVVSGYFSEIRVVAAVTRIVDGIKQVHLQKPDIVILNKVLSDGSGAEFMQCVPDHSFHTIWIAAENQIAPDINTSTHPWFLPGDFKTETLIEAINHVKEELRKNQQDKAFSAKNTYGFRLPVSTNEGLYFIPLTEIIHLKGQGSYTLIFTLHEKPLLVSKNLKEYEVLLEDKGFCRVHNSHIINLGHVKRFVGATQAFVVLADGSEVEVSKNRKEIFLKLMRTLYC